VNRLLRSLVLVALLAGATACVAVPAAGPAPALPAGATAISAPAGLFAVRPEGARGPFVAYSMPGGVERFSLPAGRLSADGKQYDGAETIGDRTLVSSYDPATGVTTAETEIAGRWELTAVSASGRWLALTGIPTEQEQRSRMAADSWKTTVQILDTRDGGRVAHALQLDGNFEVEALSADGSALFLIQYLPAIHPDHYLIRLYDLAGGFLQPDELRAKNSDEVMAGEPWDRLASPDGQWLLTLYLDTRNNTAFIHALNLANRYTACIDLPAATGDLSLLKYYALALSPDGRRLYAANAVLGLVATVDLETLQLNEARFDIHAPAALVSGKDSHQAPTAHGMTTADGRTLFFTSGQGVWAFDTTGSGAVTGPYAGPGAITGLGVSSDGRQLYVAYSDRPPQVETPAALP
jgi:hypothetical protein